MSYRAVWLSVVVCWLAGSVMSRAASRLLEQATVRSAACAAPEYRQFDFWIGDWDVFDVGSPVNVAHVRVDSILDGCVLQEDYRGYDGHKGRSFTIYDATRNIWHQTWLTNRGELLEIEGRMENGEMVLSGKNQEGVLVRGRWKPAKGEVREIAAKSSDGGKSWKPWFDLIFRPAGTQK